MQLSEIPFFPSPNYSSRGGKKITHIVLHCTEGSYPGCKSWLCNPKSQVSAHYLVNKKGALTCLVKPENKAWHVVTANGFCLGIEMEGQIADPQWVTEPMFNAAAELVAELMRVYLVPIENVIEHNDPFLRNYGNNHADCGSFFDLAKFKALVETL